MKVLLAFLFAFGMMGGAVKAAQPDLAPRSSAALAAPAGLVAEVPSDGDIPIGEATADALDEATAPALTCVSEECINECNLSGCAGGYCLYWGCYCVKCDF